MSDAACQQTGRDIQVAPPQALAETGHRRSRRNCRHCSAHFASEDDLERHCTQIHKRNALPGVSTRPSSRSAAAAKAVASSSAPAFSTSPRAPQVDDVCPPLGWCTFSGCFQEFSSWDSYVEHCRISHDASLCSLCLESHPDAHGDRDLKCSRCPAQFLCDVGLSVHKHLFHRAFDSPTREESMTVAIGWCTSEHCKLPFKSWEDHVEHQRAHHFSCAQDETMCDLCLDVMPVAHLPGHLQVHRLRDEACSRCSARFISGLSQHTVRFHRTQQPAAPGWCNVSSCSFLSSSWEVYVKHFVGRHWLKDAALVCSLCLVCHGSVCENESHAQNHAKNQNFKCKMCSAQFLKIAGYLRHMETYHRMPL